MKLNPVYLSGKYHYMTTLSRKQVMDGHLCTFHKSLMVVTEKAFFTQEKLCEAVMQYLNSGANLPFYVKSTMDLEGEKYMSGGCTIQSEVGLNEIRAECNFTEVVF